MNKDHGTQRNAPDVARMLPDAQSSAAALAAAERAVAVSRVNAWRAKEMPTRQPLSAPLSPADFTRQYVLLRHDTARLFDYVRLVAPGRCKAVFQPEIPPEVLQAAAIAIAEHASAQNLQWASEWLAGVAQVPRFEMSMMMLDAPVAKALARMFDALDRIASESADSHTATALAALRAKFK